MKKLLLAFLSSLLVAAPASTQTSIKGNVLVIVSSEEAIALRDGKTYKTGYFLNELSTAEEQIAESKQLGGEMLFYPEAAMKTAGGEIQVAEPWGSNVVQDRELITGQNPFSDNTLAEKLLSAIAQRKATK
jgi:putative intracellular protease/amidase